MWSRGQAFQAKKEERKTIATVGYLFTVFNAPLARRSGVAHSCVRFFASARSCFLSTRELEVCKPKAFSAVSASSFGPGGDFIDA